VLESASDFPKNNLISDFRSRAPSLLGVSRVVFWSDFYSALFGPYHLLPYWEQNLQDSNSAALIESVVLAQAQYFLGSPTSTLTDHVFQLMRAAGNEHGAMLAQRQHDIDTPLYSAPYQMEHRMQGFKPPARMTQLAQQTLDRLTQTIPREEQLFFKDDASMH
jgi:hypothetical protein